MSSCSCRILDSIEKASVPLRERDDNHLSATQTQTSTSGRGLPVYVMLPLDTVWLVERDGKQVGFLGTQGLAEVNGLAA